MIRIIVNGASGQMGQETVNVIEKAEDLTLVAKAGRQDNLADLIRDTQAQVVVDFTRPDCVYDNTRMILEMGAHPVIGTTGLSTTQIADLQNFAATKKQGGIIAPNFSIGAILMMQFSAQAAHYLPNVEIIELHHEKKRDAPSGTAIKTALMIDEARQNEAIKLMCNETIAGARGSNCNTVPVHSIRLPGFLAQQQVIFGSEGETLTIQHATINRACFMPGVLLACRKVTQLATLVYGLESLLD